MVGTDAQQPGHVNRLLPQNYEWLLGLWFSGEFFEWHVAAMATMDPVVTVATMPTVWTVATMTSVANVAIVTIVATMDTVWTLATVTTVASVPPRAPTPQSSDPDGSSGGSQTPFDRPVFRTSDMCWRPKVRPDDSSVLIGRSFSFVYLGRC